MKASELKEFDLSELTIDKKKYSVEDLSNLINRVSKYKKPNYNTVTSQHLHQSSTFMLPWLPLSPGGAGHGGPRLDK